MGKVPTRYTHVVDTSLVVERESYANGSNWVHTDKKTNEAKAAKLRHLDAK
jgi:hypothetical protein